MWDKKVFFQFFTGSDVKMFAQGSDYDFSNQISKLENQKYLFIKSLGRKFKEKSLSTIHDVIAEIIKSDYFLESIVGIKEVEICDLDEELIVTPSNQNKQMPEIFFDNLYKCVSCHNNSGQFLYGYEDVYGGSCEDKKHFLESLKNEKTSDGLDLIGDHPCESRIYSVLTNNCETSYGKDIGKMNKKTGVNWNLNNIELVEEYIYEIDNLNCDENP